MGPRRQGESRALGRVVAMPRSVLTAGPLAILAAAAAWALVHGEAPSREELFRAWSAVEGANPLAGYAFQRVCWQRGWLRVGSCEVTEAGWEALGGARRAA